MISVFLVLWGLSHQLLTVLLFVLDTWTMSACCSCWSCWSDVVHSVSPSCWLTLTSEGTKEVNTSCLFLHKLPDWTAVGVLRNLLTWFCMIHVSDSIWSTSRHWMLQSVTGGVFFFSSLCLLFFNQSTGDRVDVNSLSPDPSPCQRTFNWAAMSDLMKWMYVSNHLFSDFIQWSWSMHWCPIL